MASRSEEKEGVEEEVIFEDLFPSMVGRLGVDGFMEELSKGFRLLMDHDKGLITFDSLKSNSSRLLALDFSPNANANATTNAVFGGDGGDEMIREMVREGDLDGDGCLDLMEFCVLMFRLSPSLLSASRRYFQGYCNSSHV